MPCLAFYNDIQFSFRRVFERNNNFICRVGATVQLSPTLNSAVDQVLVVVLDYQPLNERPNPMQLERSPPANKILHQLMQWPC
jgi:hypothetical protein